MDTAQTPDETQLTDDQLAGMSDEEIANLDLSFLSQEPAEASAEEPEAEPQETDGDDPEDDSGSDDAGAGADDGDADPADAGDVEEGAEAESDDPADGEAAEAGGESAEGEEPKGDDDPEADDPEAGQADEIDYEAEYKRMLAPFKANGREIKVDNVDDAIALMQMGANYNKKMATLKPNMKMLKLLEKNDLLSEEKLGYMVDLQNKNPEAIRKLLKDSGMDPLDIDTQKDSDYTPSKHKVDDRELELDSVLDEIQDTPTYQKTVDLVQSQWDGESKRAVAENPQLLKVLNEHMDSGVHGVISSEVEKQRMLGRLNGLSDIAAYKQVGDEIQQRGGFDHLFQKGQPSDAQPPQKVSAPPKPKADRKTAEKKRAASSTRTAPSSKPASDVNPLTMSDEDFEKLVKTQYT